MEAILAWFIGDTLLAVAQFEEDLGGELHIIHFVVGRIQPHHHVVDLVVMGRIDHHLEVAVGTCLFFPEDLVDLASHVCERLAHHARQEQSACGSCEHQSQFDLLHFFALKPLSIGELVVKPNTFELEASDRVGVVVDIVEGRSTDLLDSQVQSKPNWVVDVPCYPVVFCVRVLFLRRIATDLLSLDTVRAAVVTAVVLHTGVDVGHDRQRCEAKGQGCLSKLVVDFLGTTDFEGRHSNSLVKVIHSLLR